MGLITTAVYFPMNNLSVVFALLFSIRSFFFTFIHFVSNRNFYSLSLSLYTIQVVPIEFSRIKQY